MCLCRVYALVRFVFRLARRARLLAITFELQAFTLSVGEYFRDTVKYKRALRTSAHTTVTLERFLGRHDSQWTRSADEKRKQTANASLAHDHRATQSNRAANNRQGRHNRSKMFKLTELHSLLTSFPLSLTRRACLDFP